MQTGNIGVYGKLPTHGDFIRRNIATAFVDVWDQWLQHSLVCSKEQLQDDWLSAFLTCPMWRFALSPGCINHQNAWIGLLFPSVDKVGRYFPMSFVIPYPANTQLSGALTENEMWFSRLERIAHATLEELPTIDELMAVLGDVEALPLKQLPYDADANLRKVYMSPQSQQLSNLVCESMLRAQHPSYSLWFAKGLSHADTLTINPGLPHYDDFSGLISGKWTHSSLVKLD